MIIAVDAVGGDYAPGEIIKGSVQAVEENDINIVLVGKKSLIHVSGARRLKNSRITIMDASQIIEADEHPMKAVLGKPDSSIVVGINMLKENKAQAFVSAGNTGALFGAAYLKLGLMEGIERPAICAILDITEATPVLLLDAGANADCKPHYLVQFAEMGDNFARRVMGIDSPRIGLLSNGIEETKGNRLVVESHELLKNCGLNFIGNIEANDMAKSKADVVVTDGFTGNVVLKTLEGMGDAVQNFKQLWHSVYKDSNVHGSTLHHSLGLQSWAKKLDFREVGGACLLGVNGNVIKAHGRSRSNAIKNAINLARQVTASNIGVLLKKEE
ncbi:MAG: phosphate acyltransferase PlsX [Dehalococcoidales bacterium]|nr:phosphate acyltransferase PlsX [Dehalococcoidales bacterium]